jgi:hypothetical protein
MITYTREELGHANITTLRKIGKEKKIPLYSSWKKNDIANIIEIILDFQDNNQIPRELLGEDNRIENVVVSFGGVNQDHLWDMTITQLKKYATDLNKKGYKIVNISRYKKSNINEFRNVIKQVLEPPHAEPAEDIPFSPPSDILHPAKHEQIQLKHNIEANDYEQKYFEEAEGNHIAVAQNKVDQVISLLPYLNAEQIQELLSPLLNYFPTSTIFNPPKNIFSIHDTIIDLNDISDVLIQIQNETTGETTPEAYNNIEQAIYNCLNT